MSTWFCRLLVAVLLLLCVAASGCYGFKESVRQTDEINPSNFYRSQIGKDIDRFNRDWDPASIYN